MNIREMTEQLERETLSPMATLSAETKGRLFPLESDGIRTDFQRDRDRIIHSKAFRRLMHKTQVFLSPEGDHYRTRLTHTLEVAQIARTIAVALRLNENLTEAMTLAILLSVMPEKGRLTKLLPAVSAIMNRAFVLLMPLNVTERDLTLLMK